MSSAIACNLMKIQKRKTETKKVKFFTIPAQNCRKKREENESVAVHCTITANRNVILAYNFKCVIFYLYLIYLLRNNSF